MNINWKVRFENPVWWAQVLCSVFLPVLTYFGLNWADMTSWSAIWALLVQAVGNPVVVVSVIVSLYNTVIDPTTAGVSDSKRALMYDAPHKDEPPDAV